MRTAVVTGISSFLGHHLVRAFAEAGWRVVGTHRTPLGQLEPPYRRRFVEVSPLLFQAERVDLTDPGGIRAVVRRHKPDVWVHHAGWARDLGSERYDLGYADQVNVLPLPELHQAMAEVGGGILVTGSGAEYGDAPGPHREDGPCWPTSAYGLSKLGETLRARQLSALHGVPVRVARVYGLYGSRDNPGRLAPTLLDRLVRRQPVRVAPGLLRDYCDAGDVARAYLNLADDLPRGPLFGIVNLCSGTGVSLTQLARAMAEATGADPGLVSEDPALLREGEPASAVGDPARAAALGWQAVPLEQGLRSLVDRSLQGVA